MYSEYEMPGEDSGRDKFVALLNHFYPSHVKVTFADHEPLSFPLSPSSFPEGNCQISIATNRDDGDYIFSRCFSPSPAFQSSVPVRDVGRLRDVIVSFIASSGAGIGHFPFKASVLELSVAVAGIPSITSYLDLHGRVLFPSQNRVFLCSKVAITRFDGITFDLDDGFIEGMALRLERNPNSISFLLNKFFEKWKNNGRMGPVLPLSSDLD